MIRKGFLTLILFTISRLFAQDTTYLCLDDSSHTFYILPSNGSLYNWTIENETNDVAEIVSVNNSENILIDLNKIGIFRVIVTETDSNGCFGMDSLLVRVVSNPSPNIYSNSSTSFCEGDSVVLTLDSNYHNILWSNGSITRSINVSQQGLYGALVTNKYGCESNSNKISVNVNKVPLVDFNYSRTCVNANTTFIANTSSSDSIISKIWKVENLLFNQDILNYNFPSIGNYDVKLSLITKDGCSDSVTKKISILSKPFADYSFYTTNAINYDSIVYFSNLSKNVISFKWNFGDSIISNYENPSHIYQKSGVYNVQLSVSDSNMCVDSIIKQIAIKLKFKFYIPNTFTPNDNSLNDSYGPVGDLIKNSNYYHFSIYNKWGELIFSTNDKNKKWDGGDSQTGVYLWSILIEDELGQEIKKSGQVNLFR